MGKIIREPFVLPDEQRSTSAAKDQKMVNCHVETIYGKKWLVKRPGLSLFLVPGGSGAPSIEDFDTCVQMGAVYLGLSSPPRTVTIVNSGEAPLNISSITAGGDYVASGSTCSVLTPAATCTFSLTFTPSVAGDRADLLTIVSDSDTSPDTFAICGTGVCADFGTVFVGLPSDLLNIVLPGTISGVTPLNANVVASSVATGSFDLTWTPTVNAEDPGTVDVILDGDTFTMELCGTAEQKTGAYLVWLPTESASANSRRRTIVTPDGLLAAVGITHSNQESGNWYQPCKNIGDTTATGLVYSDGGPTTGDVVEHATNGPLANIAAGATISIQFADGASPLIPGIYGPYDGPKITSSNAATIDGTITVYNGTPTIVVDPLFYDGGSVPLVGGSGPITTFTITNVGDAQLVGNIYPPSGFWLEGGQGFDLAPGGTHTFTLQFVPLFFGTYNTYAGIVSNDDDVHIPCTGTGT